MAASLPRDGNDDDQASAAALAPSASPLFREQWQALEFKNGITFYTQEHLQWARAILAEIMAAHIVLKKELGEI
jgi:hypothetical protein